MRPVPHHRRPRKSCTERERKTEANTCSEKKTARRNGYPQRNNTALSISHTGLHPAPKLRYVIRGMEWPRLANAILPGSAFIPRTKPFLSFPEQVAKGELYFGSADGPAHGRQLSKYYVANGLVRCRTKQDAEVE
jgi:hypothetical protein